MLVLLVSQVLPVILPFEFGEEPLDESNMATVQCAVTKGDLPISFQWLFNGSELPPDENIILSKSGKRTSVLTIETIRAYHAGNYTCVARNPAGRTNHTSDLKVIGIISQQNVSLFCVRL